MAATRPSCIASYSCIWPRPARAVSPSTTDNSRIARGRAARYYCTMHGTPRLTPEILLRAYAEGLFPMAERRGDPTLYWVSPERRGVIPLGSFHGSHLLGLPPPPQ